MCLNVGFVANVQAVIVAEFVKRRVIRIVGRSHGVKVVLPARVSTRRTAKTSEQEVNTIDMDTAPTRRKLLT